MRPGEIIVVSYRSLLRFAAWSVAARYQFMPT